MRRKLLDALVVIALVVGMFALPPVESAQAATVYCRNGDFAGLTYNSQHDMDMVGDIHPQVSVFLVQISC